MYKNLQMKFPRATRPMLKYDKPELVEPVYVEPAKNFTSSSTFESGTQNVTAIRKRVDPPWTNIASIVWFHAL